MASLSTVVRSCYVRETFCLGIVCWCNLSVCGFKMVYAPIQNTIICNENLGRFFFCVFMLDWVIFSKQNIKLVFGEESFVHIDQQK